jgi:hypothetical protein
VSLEMKKLKLAPPVPTGGGEQPAIESNSGAAALA